MNCPSCLVERRSGPCPHDAARAVEEYGRAQYVAGLRAGFDALLALVAVVDGRQVRGGRLRPIPHAIIRGAVSGHVARLVERLRATGVDPAPWTEEARKALFGGES